MYKCWVSKFVSTNETLNTYKMRTNPPLWILPIFLIFILFSCSKNEDLQVIENLSSQKTDLYSLAYKKGITNGSLNHLKNLEAEMLEEVFCYAPKIGGSNYFIIPSSRMQNFGFVNLQSSDVVIGGGGGTPTQFDAALNSSNYNIVRITKISNPCIRASLEAILHNGNLQNAMSNMLIKFNLDPRVQIDFVESYSLPNNIYGKTILYSDNTIAINLNINVLKNASKEIIFTTIYHEVLHAHLSLKKNYDQHNEIILVYRDIMSNSLNQQFPGIKYPEDLALMGLENTDYFINKLSFEQKSIYYNRRQSYLNGTNGNYCKQN